MALTNNYKVKITFFDKERQLLLDRICIPWKVFLSCIYMFCPRSDLFMNELYVSVS